MTNPNSGWEIRRLTTAERCAGFRKPALAWELRTPFGAVLPAETKEQAEQERDRLQALLAKADS